LGFIRAAAYLSALLLLTGPAAAQPRTPPPAPADDIWPWPPPDPREWWTEKRPTPPEAADPLAGRRVGRTGRPAPIDNGIDALLYRLWGLPPLQQQVVQNGEMIVEVWVRPTSSVRQVLARLTVRKDGEAFIQGRAGLGCCEPGIARRVGFDARIPPGSASRLLALRDDPLWNAPREVRVDEGGGAADALCVDGSAYDLTLVVAGRSRSVRRACDNAEVGQAAEVLQTVLGAALGHEPRFDVIFSGRADFSTPARAYQQLIADGGALKPAPNSRPQPPAFAPPPDDEPPSSNP
jgi:hypothetical protein